MDSAAALANLLASLPTYVLIVFVVFGFLWIQNKQIAIQRDATERSLRAVEEANRTYSTMQQILQQMIANDVKRGEISTLTASTAAAQTKATDALSATLAQTLPTLVSGGAANTGVLEDVAAAQTLTSATALDTSRDVKEILALMIRRGVKLDDLAKELTAVAGDIKTLAQYATAPTEAGKEAVKDIAAAPATATQEQPAVTPESSTPAPGGEMLITGTVTGTAVPVEPVPA